MSCTCCMCARLPRRRRVASAAAAAAVGCLPPCLVPCLRFRPPAAPSCLGRPPSRTLRLPLPQVVPDVFTSPASGSIYYCSSPDPETERALVRPLAPVRRALHAWARAGCS